MRTQTSLIDRMRSNFDCTIAAATLFRVGPTLILIVVLDRVVNLDDVVGPNRNHRR